VRRVVFNMRDERPAWAPPPWVAERIRNALPDGFEFVDVEATVSGRGDGGGVSDEAMRAVRGAEIILGLGLPHPLLLAALDEPRQLRWFHSGAAGVASLLHPEIRTAGITITNSAGIHGPAMAETVLGMMLHFARGLDYAVRAQSRGQWDSAPWERADGGIVELGGSTLGIVGFGGIGRELAARARALGMRVLAVRRTGGEGDGGTRDGIVHDGGMRDGIPHGGDTRDDDPHGHDTHNGVELLHGDAGIDRIFAECEFVVLTVPSTPQTRGLAGSARLARMKPGSVLINVARGDVLDEAALTDALRSRRLRGAALDVFATEPLPADSPLWQLDNVLITPHVSATTPRYWERETELIVDNVRRYVAGEELRNVVDLEQGY
jgi:phosphoglycerate dehydrogenase-like enzyme